MNRVLTAAVLVPVVLAAVVWVPEPWFAVLVLVVALMAVREFYDLAQAQGLEPYRWLGLLATTAVVLHLELPWPSAVPGLDAVLIACVLVLFIRALRDPNRMPASIGDAGATLLGVLYLGLFMGTVGAIRLWGGIWLIFLLVVVWLGDTAALYAGKLWGRHPMAPRVSPKKTWEGGAASFLVAFLAGAAFGDWMQPGSFSAHTLLLGILAAGLNIAAQAGDLVESLLKRGAQVKDSGDLLPGHGGVLDRIDAMLFAAPILWYYLAYFRS